MCRPRNTIENVWFSRYGFDWVENCSMSMKSIASPPATRPDTPLTYALARAAHCAAQLAARLASQRKNRRRFENPLAEDAQKAAEAGHAGKTCEIIRKSRAPAKDSTLRCNSKNPLTDLHEIRVESTGKSCRRHNFVWPARKNL